MWPYSETVVALRFLGDDPSKLCPRRLNTNHQYRVLVDGMIIALQVSRAWFWTKGQPRRAALGPDQIRSGPCGNVRGRQL